MIEDNTKKVIFEEASTASEAPSWFARTFGKMEKNSLRNTIFLMMASTLGVGIYTLHGVFDELSIVYSIILLFFGCFSSLFALDMYIHASKYTNDPETVGEINTLIIGKFFNYLSLVVNGIFLYLMLISFTVCISKAIFAVIETSFTDYMQEPDDMKVFFAFHRPACIAIGVLVFFLVSLRSIDKLSAFSIYCFLIHFYIIIVILSQTYSYFVDLKDKDGLKDINIAEFEFKNLFSNFGLAICTFNNVPNFLMARNLIKNPSTDRLRKAFGRANWIIYVIYIITAICGYLTVGHYDKNSNVKKVELMIFRPKLGESDYFMNFGQSILALSLVVSCSMLGFALKMIVFPYIPGKETMKHYSIAAVLCFTAAVIASRFKTVSDYMNLAGAFCGTFIVIIFPALLGLYSGYAKNKYMRAGVIIWLGAGIVCGAISTYYAVKKMI